MGNHKRTEWLEKELELNSDKISFILKSYFEENKTSSNLTEIELDRVFCLFIRKLLDTPDCVCKNSRVLSYRSIFDILITVYDSILPDDDDLTLECYKLTQFFHTKNNGQ